MTFEEYSSLSIADELRRRSAKAVPAHFCLEDLPGSHGLAAFLDNVFGNNAWAAVNLEGTPGWVNSANHAVLVVFGEGHWDVGDAHYSAAEIVEALWGMAMISPEAVNFQPLSRSVWAVRFVW